MLVTNLHIFKLHPKTFKIRRKEIPLVSVASIRYIQMPYFYHVHTDLFHSSVSPFKDGVMILHIKPPEKDLVLDLSVCDYEGVSEIVTVIVEQISKVTGIKIPVVFTKE